MKKFYKKDYYDGVKRVFRGTCKKYKGPYISFHPGKRIIHIDSFGNHVKKYDIYNAAPEELRFCFLIEFIIQNNYQIFNGITKS